MLRDLTQTDGSHAIPLGPREPEKRSSMAGPACKTNERDPQQRRDLQGSRRFIIEKKEAVYRIRWKFLLSSAVPVRVVLAIALAHVPHPWCVRRFRNFSGDHHARRTALHPAFPTPFARRQPRRTNARGSPLYPSSRRPAPGGARCRGPQTDA